jgi:glycine cleavage system H protein
MVALLVLFAVLVFLTVDYFVQRRHQVVPATAKSPGLAPLVMHDPNYRTPQGVYFDHGHAWAFLEESGDALVGVDDLVRTIMGSIERIEVAPKGTKVKKGEPLIELFHGDRSIVVESPFAGVVAGVNKTVAEGEESRPFISDWLCAVRPEDAYGQKRKRMAQA